MKQILFTAVVATTFAISGTAIAQSKTLKVGNVNSDELLSLMPERKKAAEELEKHQKDLQKQLEAMGAEYQALGEKLDKEAASMTEVVKNAKIEEIKSLEERIRKFQTSAEESIQKKQQTLLEPIVKKAKKAVEDVAKENGYSYVVDTSQGVFIYFEQTDNILPLVKKKLGIL